MACGGRSPWSFCRSYTLDDENKTPEQIARDATEARLSASGWSVQRNRKIDHSAGPGIAVREYQTSIGPADYVLFAERKALGVGEAKPDSWGPGLRPSSRSPPDMPRLN